MSIILGFGLDLSDNVICKLFVAYTWTHIFSMVSCCTCISGLTMNSQSVFSLGSTCFSWLQCTMATSYTKSILTAWVCMPSFLEPESPLYSLLQSAVRNMNHSHVLNVSGTTVIITDLTPGNTYEFKVGHYAT